MLSVASSRESLQSNIVEFLPYYHTQLAHVTCAEQRMEQFPRAQESGQPQGRPAGEQPEEDSCPLEQQPPRVSGRPQATAARVLGCSPADDSRALVGVFWVPLRAEGRQVPVEVVAVHYTPVRGAVRPRRQVPHPQPAPCCRGDGSHSCPVPKFGGFHIFPKFVFIVFSILSFK